MGMQSWKLLGTKVWLRRVTAKVCEIPVTYNRGNVSMVKVLQESGYLDAYRQLTTELVASHLRRHPELIEGWIRMSEDKRGGSGWYLLETSESSLELGHYPDGPRQVFADRITGCAEFILREAESIGSLMTTSGSRGGRACPR